MKLQRPSAEQAPYALRAMTMVARAAAQGLGKPQRALLAAAQHVILRSELDVDSLTPISPQELAEHFPDAALRRQLIQGMLVMSLVDGPASHEQAKLISAFAAAMKVDEPALRVIEHLAEHELLMFRLDFYRRSHLRDAIESTYRMQGGLLSVAKTLLGFKGLVEDKALAARFHAWADLPEGSLGKAVHDYYLENGFAFPGEAGGFPYGMVYHDFAHILSGNPPTPEGELRVAAFQAGFRRNENAFFTILFAVLTQTAGINMSPVEQPVLLGRIGEGDLAEEVIKEVERGSEMNIDLGADWDFWPFAALRLDEARRRLGIRPKA